MATSAALIPLRKPTANIDFAINMKTQDAYSPGQWNAIVRAGLQAACDYWIDNYLMLRFQQYARAMGIYTGKKRKGLPLVSTGNLAHLVRQTTRATVMATSKKAEAIIHIPMPNVANATPTKNFRYFNYASNPVVQDTLSKITADEIRRMSEVCALVMTEMIESSTITISRGRVVKTLLPGGQTQDFHGYQSQVGRTVIGAGKIRARLADQHRISAKQFAQRARTSGARPRLTLADFHRRSSRGVA